MVAEYREKIDKIFSDVPPEHRFWLVKGGELKNLEELSLALETIDDATFNHHVTEDKNDFSEWIRNVIQDTDLAETLLKIKTKESTMKAIRLRIDSLKNIKSIHEAIDKVREGIEVQKSEVELEKKAMEEAENKALNPEEAPKTSALPTSYSYQPKKQNLFSDINLYIGVLIGFLLGVLLGSLM